MKKYLKLFIIVFLLLNIIGGVNKVMAEDPIEIQKTEIERSEEKINKYCPSANNPNLVSICGRVTQATAQPQVLYDGTTAPSVSQVPVKGVSVYLYECDNTSRSCKRDGLLVHPFSSTSTNKDGVFHLVGRKLENSWVYEYENQYTNNIEHIEEDVTITNQSKKRYLVFKCGNYFQGIHIIPSYLNLTEIIHEVHCPNELSQTNDGEFLYVPPYLQFDFIGGVKLAAQMGVDPEDPYYPLQSGSHVDENSDDVYDGIRTTVQAHYNTYANLKNSSVPVILNGADPRFTSPDKDAGKKDAIAAAAGGLFRGLIVDWGLLGNFVPTLGAWWSKDCEKQYTDNNPLTLINWATYCYFTEDDLYTESKYNTATLLPALPPTQSILYYRPLEIRNEISAYYQDHDDLAKYLGLMFANCVGDVYKREWEKTDVEEDKPDYPNCEWLKECNEAVNYSGNANSLTTSGFARAFMAPNNLDELKLNMDPETPVCLISGNTAPVKISQIQRPDHITCQEYNPDTGEGMRLCDDGAYWNNYYYTNLGNNNSALQWGMAGENKEDSYETGEESYINLTSSGIYVTDGETRGAEVNSNPMQLDEEGKKLQAGGQGAISGTGDRAANNSGGALMEITSNKEVSSTENLTNFLKAPGEEDEVKKEISKGTPYYISSRPVAWGQYSKTNEYSESIITTGSHDTGVDLNGDGKPEGGYLDSGAFSKEMECESCGEEHYPEDIFENNISIAGGKDWGGSRTPFEGISVTSTAKERLANLQTEELWKDRIDTAISLSTGHSYIDWGMVKMKGKPDFGNTIEEIMERFKNLFLRIFDGQNRTYNKTFADREPSALNDQINEANFKYKDDLVAYGFKVNESNFTDLFHCPSGCVNSPGCWGGPGTDAGKEAVKECYPWHPLPRGEACGTSTTECTTIPGTSRTCRVDKCESGTVTFTYDCGPIPIGGGPIELIIKDKKVVSNPGVCPNSIDSCAFDPLKGTGDSPDDINPGVICKPSQAGQTGFTVGPIYYDYCRVSRAGPNQCDGNILLDAEVATYSQTIHDQNNDNSPDSYNADQVPESGIYLFKAFREPFTEDITPMPAAWVSVSSSLSETEPDVSLRKDFPGIGSGANFLTRAQFGQPQPVFHFTELEPLYIHCENGDLVNIDGELGTTGNWDDGKICDFAELPDPEVIKLEDLQRELDMIENPPCMLREELSTCEQLILSGTNTDGRPMKFSETFKLILNLAGNKFGIEPAAILAYMHKTGADKTYAYLWSEEGEKDLQKVTLPWYGAFPFCDDLEPVKQPPYDWKLSWFSEMINSVVPGKDSPKAELERLSNRQETASRCNFLDSTFTLAASIARNVTKEVNGDKVLISCPDQKWDSTMIEAMKIQYHQIQIRPEDELKGTLGDDPVFTPEQEYQEIWNACR